MNFLESKFCLDIAELIEEFFKKKNNSIQYSVVVNGVSIQEDGECSLIGNEELKLYTGYKITINIDSCNGGKVWRGDPRRRYSQIRYHRRRSGVPGSSKQVKKHSSILHFAGCCSSFFGPTSFYHIRQGLSRSGAVKFRQNRKPQYPT